MQRRGDNLRPLGRVRADIDRARRAWPRPWGRLCAGFAPVQHWCIRAVVLSGWELWLAHVPAKVVVAGVGDLY